MVEQLSIIYLQEHFLSCDWLPLIDLSDTLVTAFSVAFHQQNWGHPSRGLAALSTYQLQNLEVSEHFVAVAFNDLAVKNVYLPTNCFDQASEALLSLLV